MPPTCQISNSAWTRLNLKADELRAEVSRNMVGPAEAMRKWTRPVLADRDKLAVGEWDSDDAATAGMFEDAQSANSSSLDGRRTLRNTEVEL